MKTRIIPAVVMLLAGFLTCVMGIIQHMETGVFIRLLLIVLIVFYILGCVIKVILDKNFLQTEESEEQLQEEQMESENAETEQEEEQTDLDEE